MKKKIIPLFMMRLPLVLVMVVAISGCQTTGSSSGSSSEPMAQHPAVKSNIKLAVGYLERGYLEVAQEKIDRALRIDPDSAQAHSVAAVVYERLGDMEAVDHHYQRAGKLAPNDPNIQNNYGVYLCRQQEYEAADRAFQVALRSQVYATPAAAYANAGVCAMKAGKLDVAEQYLRQVLQYEATNGDALFSLAKLMHGRGENLKARAFLQRYEGTQSTVSEEFAMLALSVAQSLNAQDNIDKYKKILEEKYPGALDANSS